jgi:hypothetical protein
VAARRARARGDRGAIAASVAVVPIIMGVLLTVVQVSLWYYGRAVGTAAAQHGLDAARVEDGTEAAGEAMAGQFLAQTGGLDASSIEVVRTPEEATITIDGNVATLVPLFEVPVHVSLSAPVERVVE